MTFIRCAEIENKIFETEILKWSENESVTIQ